jgi:endonuclease/exonuclease/phosphatase family metal-dependent hydrolase
MSILRIMTFNVRGAHCADGDNEWPKRAALNVAVIRRHAPDLIGFQELQVENIYDYDEGLESYGPYPGPPYGDAEPFAYPGIWWNPERLTALDPGGFWLSETPDEHSASWDTACIRSAAWMRFRVADGKTELVHLNTHLDHVSERARVEGARLIVERTRRWDDEGTPMIVTGDFNCPPDSEPYEVLASAGFEDVFRRVGCPSEENESTFHAFTGAPDHSFRMDWILVRPGTTTVTVERCAAIRDAEPPLYPSDHFPVIADVLFAG